MFIKPCLNFVANDYINLRMMQFNSEFKNTYQTVHHLNYLKIGLFRLPPWIQMPLLLYIYTYLGNCHIFISSTKSFLVVFHKFLWLVTSWHILLNFGLPCNQENFVIDVTKNKTFKRITNIRGKKRCQLWIFFVQQR